MNRLRICRDGWPLERVKSRLIYNAIRLVVQTFKGELRLKKWTPIRCHTCKRMSYSEMEHLTHKCFEEAPSTMCGPASEARSC